jgi:bifunctional oligoribonuclease and PAP phosphatase NrnA
VSDLARVAAALQAAPSVAVLAHVNPEGDAIGSTLAATLALREAGKRTAALNADPVPPDLLQLPGASEVRRAVPPEKDYGCYLVVDTATLGRTGGLLDGRRPGTMVVNVDHHGGNTRFGDVNWVEPEASSAGEMVLRLIRTMDLPISRDVAANLYAAILTDTGGFRYGNTTAASLRAAADLVDAGAVPEAIVQGFSARRVVGEWRLLGEVLAGMESSSDGRVAWIEVTAAACRRAGVGMEVAEDFIQYPRDVAGVRIAVAFKELSDDEMRVSFRSSGSLDVAALAAAFGGGGHRNAAGCTVRGGLAAAKAAILAAAEALLR